MTPEILRQASYVPSDHPYAVEKPAARLVTEARDCFVTAAATGAAAAVTPLALAVASLLAGGAVVGHAVQLVRADVSDRCPGDHAAHMVTRAVLSLGAGAAAWVLGTFWQVTVPAACLLGAVSYRHPLVTQLRSAIGENFTGIDLGCMGT